MPYQKRVYFSLLALSVNDTYNTSYTPTKRTGRGYIGDTMLSVGRSVRRSVSPLEILCPENNSKTIQDIYFKLEYFDRW